MEIGASAFSSKLLANNSPNSVHCNVPSRVTLRTPQGELVIGAVPRVVGTLSAFPVPGTARDVCDIVEVRLDLLGTGVTWPPIDLPVLLTIRSNTEGGQWSGPDKERLELYRKWIPLVAAVDVELNSSIAGDVCKLARDAGKASIVSFHDFSATPTLEVLEAIVERGRGVGSLVKIVTLANTERDVEILRTLLSKRQGPLCVMGMGQQAAMTRLEFPKLGSCLTYGYLDKPLAPGQTSAAELSAQLRK
ncbi:MAG: 3-dehydroquinate dehydratase, type [Verrucomicrobiales bacterium]|nr:3-dehydroquinate dehydratase, type [Verrucomicrobiales bacterium]